MSKNINLVCDDKALLVGAAELASDLGLRLTSSGVTVNAVKGTELSVRKNGEGYVLTYRRKHEFFRGLSLIRDAVAAAPIMSKTENTICFAIWRTCRAMPCSAWTVRRR